MRNIPLMILIAIILLFAGCQQKPKSNFLKTDSSDTNFTKLSTNHHVDQSKSNDIKEILKNNPDISSILAVNSKDQMLVTFEIDHIKRFRLEKIRENIEKQVKEKHPQLDVQVSTDQKIINELNDLENQIHSNQLSENQIEEKIKELISLAKEET